jgi:hypothetical protein
MPPTCTPPARHHPTSTPFLPPHHRFPSIPLNFLTTFYTSYIQLLYPTFHYLLNIIPQCSCKLCQSHIPLLNTPWVIPDPPTVSHSLGMGAAPPMPPTSPPPHLPHSGGELPHANHHCLPFPLTPMSYATSPSMTELSVIRYPTGSSQTH